MKTLFAFSILEEMEIKELEIVKETPKQYVVKNYYGGNSCDFVHKSRMENGYRKYFETKDQAIQGLKDYCNKAIGWAENEIKRQNEHIANYKKILARLEEGKQ